MPSMFAKALKKARPRTESKPSEQTPGVDDRLHDYQKDGVRWLVERPLAGLFLAPGLGKTLIVLTAYRLLRMMGKVERLVVIAPLRVCHYVWPAEVRKWGFGFSVGVLHGPSKDRALSEKHDIYVINPDGLSWFYSRTARDRQWFAAATWLVVDESSMFRNGRSQRFKTLKALLKLFDRRTILTGTPAPNGLEGLWGQVYLLDRGQRLGEYVTVYRNRYFYPSGYGGYTYKPQEGAPEKIYRVLGDIIMSRGREVLTLPPLVSNTIPVALTGNAWRVYKDMRDEFIADIEAHGIVAAVNGAVASGKLRQITGGCLYDGNGDVVHVHDEKLSALRDLVDELEGQQLMIFYEFDHERNRLMAAFPHAECFGGGTSTAAGAEIERRWNAGETELLLLHPRSAGHGLNLQGSRCRDICWFTTTWDLELYEQAFSRVWRQGVGDSVTMHHIVAIGTTDEIVLKALKNKTKVQDELKKALAK